jgi:hypothetical protein
VSRDVGLGHDPAAGAPFIDHGDAPNLILLHHPAAVLDAHFRRDGHTGAGHAIARRHPQRVLTFGHGPATDVAIGHDGCVAKNHLGHKNTERYFSSGGAIEEIGPEFNLSSNVAFPDSFNLSLPDHVHGLIPADGPPRRVETEEAESGIDSTFYESVILLDDIIEKFALA